MKRQKKIFFVLLTVVLVLSMMSFLKAQGLLLPESEPVLVEGKTVYLHSMTTEQKIAQMVVVGGIPENYHAWRRLQVGGVHLFAQTTEYIFKQTIIDYQYGQPIPFFITADAEGCVTPFIHVKNFTSASDVVSVGAAYEKGFRDGAYLKDLGFNLNFAPVVDLDDDIWNCRAFPGSAENISEFAQAYILGLQSQGVIATIKHYPGKTLVVKDPHKFVVETDINEQDILPYDYLLGRGDVQAVMVSHLITHGEVETNGLPSVTSKAVIDDIKKEYTGLVISDEIHMLGLKNFYGTLDEMYIAVYAAGNDVILNFDRDPYEVYRMIQVVSAAVERGEIPVEQIDASVTKILRAKGLHVVAS